MDNGMAPRRKWFWQEIRWTDFFLILIVLIFEGLKIAANRTSQGAAIKMEAFKEDLNDPGAAEKMKAYEKTNWIYSRVFLAMELFQVAFLVKKLLPVDPDVETQMLYRENAALHKKIDKLEKDSINYQQLWRVADTEYDKLKGVMKAMEQRALDAEHNLTQALLDLKSARAEAAASAAEQEVVDPQTQTQLVRPSSHVLANVSDMTVELEVGSSSSSTSVTHLQC